MRTPIVQPSAELSLQNAWAACASISTLQLSSVRVALTSRSATYAMGGEWDVCPSLPVIITIQPCSGWVFLCVNFRLTNSGHFAVVTGETGVSPTTFLFFSFLFFRGFILLKPWVFGRKLGVFGNFRKSQVTKTMGFREKTRGFREII